MIRTESTRRSWWCWITFFFHPFFTILSGKIFNGESGDCEPFVIERVNKQGKTVRSKIVPATYREKVEIGLWGENYAFADHDFSNAEEIATQIMEIV